MRIELKRLQREVGTTMVYVTHDQTEALSMSQRIAIMNLGVLQQVGTPLDVYNRPATLFVAGFISDFPEVRDTELPIVYVALTALSVAIPLGILHLYGRVYRIKFKVTDAAGNVTTATAKVTVPKSQGGSPAVDDGPAYTVNGTCP